MRPLHIATAPKRDSFHWSNETITWDDFLRWTEEPADHREAGNYMFGQLATSTVGHAQADGSVKTCTGVHRRKPALMLRSVVMVDVDYADEHFLDNFDLTFPYRAVLHSTWSHTPAEPRYRIAILPDRDMTPDEYHTIASWCVDAVGRDACDPSTTQAERYMFRPSTQDPATYVRRELDGPELPVDHILATYVPPVPPPSLQPKNKRDPFELAGVVGAFNRTYDIDAAIEAYALPYEQAGPGRWKLKGSVTEAGVSLVADGLVHSHHANDPAFDQTCNAFDLVRLHRFAELDKDVDPKTPVNRRPSQTAAMALVGADPAVVGELVGLDFAAELEEVAESQSWRLKLKHNLRTGEFIDVIGNWDLIRENVDIFAGLHFNEMSLTIETDRDLPWRPLSRGGATFTGTDRAALAHWIEREFRHRPLRTLLDELVNTTADARHVNPVRDYLEALEWDGTPRVERCLPGVRETPYTRMVARKSMVAAAARMLSPGCKWDHTLVLFGPEGVGKSWWIERVAKGYANTLGPISSKDTLIAMQRSWIMVADEGHSLRKGDADAQKEFLTRTGDTFRMPYEREAQVHPRHNVIWGTTNDEVFLRRQEGNRRFLIVRCEEKVNFDLMTPAYVDQLWAEAVALYRSGEPMFLSADEGALAAGEREGFTEEDALGGLIHAYVDRLVPAGWSDMTPEDRQLWEMNRNDEFVAEGTERVNEICSAQVWVEVLGRRLGEHKRSDLLEITAALKRMPEWEVAPGRRRVPHYGPQVVYRRVSPKG